LVLLAAIHTRNVSRPARADSPHGKKEVSSGRLVVGLVAVRRRTATSHNLSVIPEKPDYFTNYLFDLRLSAANTKVSPGAQPIAFLHAIVTYNEPFSW
jgi:hypothetical protein